MCGSARVCVCTCACVRVCVHMCACALFRNKRKTRVFKLSKWLRVRRTTKHFQENLCQRAAPPNSSPCRLPLLQMFGGNSACAARDVAAKIRTRRCAEALKQLKRRHSVCKAHEIRLVVFSAVVCNVFFNGCIKLDLQSQVTRSSNSHS